MDESELIFSQIIDSSLDAIADGRESLESVLRDFPDEAEDIQDAMQAARALRSYQKYLTPSDNFIVDSKQLLLSRLPKTGRQPSKAINLSDYLRSFLRVNWVTSMVLLALLLVSLTGITYAAGPSVPGDLVYPVKTWFENANVLLQNDPARKSEFYMVLASRRLAEMEILAGRGQYALVDETMVIYQMDVDASVVVLDGPGDQNVQNKLELAQDFALKLQEHLLRLETLQDKLPEQAQAGIERAIQVSGHGLSTAQQAIQGNHPVATNTRVPTKRPTFTDEPKDDAGVGNSNNSAEPTPRPSPTKKPTRTPKPDGEENKQHPIVPTPRGKPDK